MALNNHHILMEMAHQQVAERLEEAELDRMVRGHILRQHVRSLALAASVVGAALAAAWLGLLVG
jgi:hypothetical protein